MFFSILIVSNYKRFNLLNLLIESIEFQNNIQSFDFEILLANQSEIHYPNKKINIKEFSILESESLSYSRNKLINYSAGKYLIFLDDDCIIEKNYLNKLYHIILDNTFPDFISGNIFNLEDRKLYNKNLKQKNFLHNIYTYESCLSSNMAVKKKSLINVGLFDENFGLGSKYNSNEESDLLLSFIKKNYRCVHNPLHIVYHPKYDESNFTLFLIKNRSLNYGIGKGSLIRKHMNLGIYWFAHQVISCLSKPLLLFLLSLIFFRQKSICRYLYTFLGRLRGLFHND